MSWLPHAEVSDPAELRKENLNADLMKLDNILSASHIDYELIGKKDIADIKNYKTMIFPNLTALGELNNHRE